MIRSGFYRNNALLLKLTNTVTYVFRLVSRQSLLLLDYQSGLFFPGSYL